MTSISLNSLKLGDFVKIENQPFIILSAQHTHMGRGGAILRIKIKNLISEKVLEKTFKGDEKIEEADIKRKGATFLYGDEKNVFFMETETYEQFSLSKEIFGEKEKYLKEGCEVDILTLDEQAINVEIPKKVELKVISAPPGMRGDTAQGSVTKQVTLETGLVVNAPLFVKEGDVIRINTEKNEYVERVNQ